jgi:hypothetical protein
MERANAEQLIGEVEEQRSRLAGVFAVALVVAAVSLYLFHPPHGLSLSLAFLGLGSLLVGAWNLRQVASAE